MLQPFQFPFATYMGLPGRNRKVIAFIRDARQPTLVIELMEGHQAGFDAFLFHYLVVIPTLFASSVNLASQWYSGVLLLAGNDIQGSEHDRALCHGHNLFAESDVLA